MLPSPAGAQLQAALENGVSQWPKLEGRFPQVFFALKPWYAHGVSQRLEQGTAARLCLRQRWTAARGDGDVSCKLLGSLFQQSPDRLPCLAQQGPPLSPACLPGVGCPLLV